MEGEKFKARDVQPTVLRIHPELRQQLMRIAAINGRSLSKEINQRLLESLKNSGDKVEAVSPETPSLALGPENNSAVVSKPVPYALSDYEASLVEVFRSMSAFKRYSLLVFLQSK